MNIKRKIKFAFLVIILLVLVGFVVYHIRMYNNSEEVLKSKYQDEVKDVINLLENEQVIKAVKIDLNADESKDYLFLVGKAVNIEKNKAAINMEAENKMYEKVSLIYINSDLNVSSKLETTKSFSSDIFLEIKNVGVDNYVLAYNSNGSVLFCNLKENNFVDIIANSDIKELNGYTPTIKWNESDETKLKITLDNYNRAYLSEKKDEYTLDFSGTEINKLNYRQSYLANNFSKLNVVVLENSIALVAEQNVLYLNKEIETIMKTAGVIKTTFKVENNKLVFTDVNVEI